MIENHAERAAALLVSQFCSKPRFNSLVQALAGGVQSLENATEEVRTERSINTAIGAQLDLVGDIVGEFRLGRDDQDYRQAILFRIFINLSQGRPDEVIVIFDYITDSLLTRYFEQYPGKVAIQSIGTELPEDFADIMTSVLPAGVCLQALAIVPADQRPFAFEGDEEIGGHFAEIAADGSLLIEPAAGQFSELYNHITEAC